ncbi:hypothetical protein D3C81_2330580 [compost metagenome]
MAWYLKGMKAAARVKDFIMEETKRDEMVRILNQFVTQLKEEEEQEALNPSLTAV